MPSSDVDEVPSRTAAMAMKYCRCRLLRFCFNLFLILPAAAILSLSLSTLNLLITIWDGAIRCPNLRFPFDTNCNFESIFSGGSFKLGSSPSHHVYISNQPHLLSVSGPFCSASFQKRCCLLTFGLFRTRLPAM